jgi:hypothetical protein
MLVVPLLSREVNATGRVIAGPVEPLQNVLAAIIAFGDAGVEYANALILATNFLCLKTRITISALLSALVSLACFASKIVGLESLTALKGPSLPLLPLAHLLGGFAALPLLKAPHLLLLL